MPWYCSAGQHIITWSSALWFRGHVPDVTSFQRTHWFVLLLRFVFIKGQTFSTAKLTLSLQVRRQLILHPVGHSARLRVNPRTTENIEPGNSTECGGMSRATDVSKEILHQSWSAFALSLCRCAKSWVSDSQWKRSPRSWDVLVRCSFQCVSAGWCVSKNTNLQDDIHLLACKTLDRGFCLVRT